MGAYAPFDNTTLTFKVYSSFSVDPNTGNSVPVNTEEVYTANLQLQDSTNKDKPGVDENDIPCSGRLLIPTEFSSNVKIGSEAACTVNNITGTFRLTDLGSNTLPFARNTVFQSFTGVFEQTGRAG